MLAALTRSISPSIVHCALTFRERQQIDYALAVRQHDLYQRCLRRHGVQIVAVPPEPDLPDGVFVEDTAVVVDEVAVMTQPALESRAREVNSVASTLSRYRTLRRIQGDGRIEGGDVLKIGRSLYAGLSQRTNQEGVSQLGALLGPFGYEVHAVPMNGCLHLKSACTFIAKNTILANPDWIDTEQIAGCEVISVDPGEPDAANALLVGETVILPASFPLTRKRLEDRGFVVDVVDVSELQKAEAGVTCCSILLQTSLPHEDSRPPV